ncbi:MAG TPA: hypothetical protein VN541_16720 [Tepidisphaeraceae bacterium]|nr:hypothetical protein [Tepidisphaeraceae bacterium]
MRRGSRAWDEATDTITHPAEYPYRTGGLILLILALIGFVYFFPEMHREARIMRM